jgi:hypothetical protein
MNRRLPPGPPVSFIESREAFDAPQRMPGGPSMRVPTVDLNGQPVQSAGGVDTTTPVGDNWHSANIISGQVAVGNLSSTKFLDMPVNRRNLLMLRNYSATANIYIEFNRDASDDSVIRLTPNTMMLFDSVVPQDDVYAYGDAANAILSYAYSNVKY